MYWLWYILIGIVAGYLGSLVVKGTGSGLLLNLVIGVIGSVLGGWLFGLMGLDSTNMLGSLITATIGAIVLLLIVALFTRKRY
ncbi:MAG: GlsB/YeaQ/YmgE family stress response membrane protein [Rikenellaceae bacterium]|nr:GlsB/YeaQ/YmgE family stress response membrane protein [Rikenellaceae bacterium]